MIAEQIEEDARRLDEIIAGYNREANRAKQSRDEFHRRASELADRRDKLQKKAKSLSAEAAVYKARRDDANLTAKECRARRDEWNDRGARMRASGGLGDIGECKSQANSWHQKAVKASEDANTDAPPPLTVTGGTKESVPLQYEGPFRYLDTKGADLASITKELQLPETAAAPVQKEAVAGKAVYRLDGAEIGSVKLLYAASVPRARFLDYFQMALDAFFL